MAILGIDFGTTYSFIVKYDGKDFTLVGKKLYTLSQSQTSDPLATSKGIRTAIGKTNDGKWIVGLPHIKEALKNGTLQQDNICWDIKTLLRNINQDRYSRESVENGFDDYGVPEGLRYGKYFSDGFKSADELAKEFFKYIFDNNSVDLSDITHIVCGMPSDELNFASDNTKFSSDMGDSEIYKNKLREQILGYINTEILKLDLPEESLIMREEPILAGISFFHFQDNRLKDDDNVLVVDVGGGTSDFALFNVKEKEIVRIDSRGNASPAGNNFNQALLNCIVNKCSSSFPEEAYKSEDFSEAKEKLFLYKFGSTISSLAKRHNKTLEDIYNEFVSHGRRTELKYNGVTYKIVYSEEDKRGIQYDGYGDSWDKNDKEGDINDIVVVKSAFEEIYRQISVQVKEFLKRDKVKQYANKISKILFVGGSCGIPELQDFVCATALDLKCKNEKYYRKASTKEVFKYFLNVESKSKLTCSNAVAIGAALEGDKASAGNAKQDKNKREVTNTLNIPEVWIKFACEEDNEYLLFNSEFKTQGTCQQKFIPPLQFTFDKRECHKTKKNDYFVRFRIGRAGGVDESKRYYPFRRYCNNEGNLKEVELWYSYKVTALFDESDKCSLIFLADITTSGNFAVFLYCDKRVSVEDVSKVKYQYKYKYLEKEEIVPVIIGGNKANRGSSPVIFDGRRNNLKKYEFSLDKNKFKGCPFSALNYADKRDNMQCELTDKNMFFGWYKI